MGRTCKALKPKKLKPDVVMQRKVTEWLRESINESIRRKQEREKQHMFLSFSNQTLRRPQKGNSLVPFFFLETKMAIFWHQRAPRSSGAGDVLICWRSSCFYWSQTLVKASDLKNWGIYLTLKIWREKRKKGITITSQTSKFHPNRDFYNFTN